jgi:hypothetical protein
MWLDSVVETSERSETFRVDGERVGMSLAWRLAFRRQYRSMRRRGYGPMASKFNVEDEILSILNDRKMV